MSQNILEKYYLGPKLSKQSSKSLNKIQSSSNSIISNNNDLLTTSGTFDYSLSNEFAKIFVNFIVPYLSIKDVVNLKLSNKTLSVLLGQKSIKNVILSNSTKGFSSEVLRYKIWKHYLEYKFFKGDLYELYPNFKTDDGEKVKKSEKFYKYILEQGEKIKKGEKVEELTEEKIKQINVSISYLIKDIDRTYYTKRFTEGDGINELNRVLEGVSIIKNNVGYCQGMNFIGGSLIQLLNSESKAFMVFNCLLKEYELSNLFAYVRNINYF